MKQRRYARVVVSRLCEKYSVISTPRGMVLFDCGDYGSRGRSCVGIQPVSRAGRMFC